ncbi:MAG: DEAD/DEAH box helicase [Myxococcales bacterium]|nr:DEAD/DEAH box helicase [Myxococcales bacterium]
MNSTLQTALSNMERDQATAMRVMATAADWRTPTALRTLEETLLAATNFTESSLKSWKKWISEWLHAGWLALATDRNDKPYYQLHLGLRHVVLKQTDRWILKGFADALDRYYWRDNNWLRQARLALYMGDHRRFLQSMRQSHDDDFWIDLFGPAPPPDVLAMFPEECQDKYLGILGNHALELVDPPADVLLRSSQECIAPYRIALYALCGDIPAAQAELALVDPAADATGMLHAAACILELANNNSESAKTHAGLALTISKGKRKYPSLSGPFSGWVALCALAGSPEQQALAELLLTNPKRRSGYTHHFDVGLLAFLDWIRGGSDTPLSRMCASTWGMHNSALATIIHCVLVSWNVSEDNAGNRDEITGALKECGYHWLLAEFLSLGESKEQAGTLGAMFAPKPAWERKLDTLSVFVESAKKPRRVKPKREVEQRIVWLIDCDYESYEMSALLQKRGKAGYSKGREVLARDLRKKRDMPWVDEHDRAIVEAVEAVPSYRGSKIVYRFGTDCFSALVGHPRILWAQGREPAEVAKGQPSLRVIRKKPSILVSPTPWARQPGQLVAREGNRLLVYDVDAQYCKLCEAVGGPSLELPAEAEEQLSRIMGAFPANIPLHTDIAPEGSEMREVQADPRLVLHLRRASDVLRVSWCVMPLGDEGPVCKAGCGNEVLVAEVDGHPTKARRDLAGEREREKALLKGCPSLGKAERSHEDYVVRGLGATLSLLHELHDMGDAIVCLWKEGEPMHVDMSADMAALQIKFGDTNEWLTADIRVEVSDKISLRTHEIVSKMVPGLPRFVQLDSVRFMALDETLSSKLAELSGLGNIGKKGLSMGPANAYALSAWLGDIDSKCAKKGAKLATKRLAKVRESVSLDIRLPKTFKAELRPYQLDAYNWLSRLAHWGGGALLCDDMGLGKTVQMLAVLAERGPKGPALVVAPVSVGPHWAALMQQFAPTLNPRQLGVSGREETLADLGPRDVLLVSYGLLHNECERLTKRSFTTILLDEAQAIKNPRSNRARAAFKLQGDFRAVTTGTPIENNLGELWSIMNFVNPGLLGTSRQFSDRFGKPIQKDGDKEASQKLRRLLAPFLLRRTKAQVLTELPSKTEVTLEIEPGEQEAAFYAAMRDSMLAEFQAGKDRPAQQRIQILAALMKLRRIACHPSLGDANSSCGSAKQEAFLQLVDELREAGHRILVFSQFVGHLAIARVNLDAREIPYQYLDGSTSKAKRKKAVDAFQSGEGDVFLISLKAGGVGLHLTGADYVIHLDPWWNPAVEDQASDRAHRMGQTRPVTVYRLVTKGTVEQRVLELHSRKRQLAEDLISGNENAGSLGVTELMDLMTDVGETA